MPGRRLIIIIAVLMPWLQCGAQVIRGNITDEKGLPMAAASVYITELRQGTTTNNNGFYEISLPAGTYTISYQFLGYTPVTRVIAVTEDDYHADITLTEQLFEIPAVRVSASGKDPAYYIMRKAVGMAPFHLNRVKMYRAEVYIRGGGSVDKIPPMLRRRMKIEANQSEFEEGKYYFSESLNIITFTAPDKYVHRVVSSNSSMPVSEGQASPMDYLKASFYQPVLAGVAISPLAPNAFSHYSFTFLGSSSQGDYVIDKIRVTPRRKSQQLFSGVIYIVEEMWAIQSLDLTNENLAGKVRIRQLYTPVEEGIWMPVSHEFDVDISIMGVRARAAYTSAVKYLEVEPDRSLAVPSAFLSLTDAADRPQPKAPEQREIEAILSGDDISARDMARLARLNEKNAQRTEEKPGLEITDKTTFVIDEDATQKDSSYWNKARPIPLTAEERATVEVVSASGTPLSRRDTSTISVTLGSGGKKGEKSPAATFIKDLATGKRWQLSKDAFLEFNGLADLKSFSFNTVDGFVAGTGMNLSMKTGEAGRFTLAPSARIAFSRNQLMWNVTANLLYDPMRAGNLFVRAGHQSDEFSPSGVNPLVNTVSSLFFRQNYMKLYDSFYLIAGHRGDLANGLNLSLSAMIEQRTFLNNFSSFSIFRRDNPYSPNIPDNPFINGEVEGYDLLPFSAYTHMEATAGLTWTPRQRYRISGGAKIYAGSDFPTFSLTWKHGYNHGESHQGHYDMLMAEIFLTKSSGPLSEFLWRIRSGGFCNNQNLKLQDMYYFNTQYSPVLLNNYEDAFYLKPWYSVSSPRGFAEGHIRYTSPTLLLKRLPGLSRTLARENIGLSALWTPDLGFYYETGYTISEIFLIAEVGVYAGFRDTSFESVSLRLILRLN
ncbi:MAG: DUF5686 and carboxypeptidase regulatory-like domain-containing protein [Bacteroidales bacterium]